MGRDDVSFLAFCLYKAYNTTCYDNDTFVKVLRKKYVRDDERVIQVETGKEYMTMWPILPDVHIAVFNAAPDVPNVIAELRKMRMVCDQMVLADGFCAVAVSKKRCAFEGQLHKQVQSRGGKLIRDSISRNDVYGRLCRMYAQTKQLNEILKIGDDIMSKLTKVEVLPLCWMTYGDDHNHEDDDDEYDVDEVDHLIATL